MITLVAACWVLTEERCDASCGDYLVHHGSSGSHAVKGLLGNPNSPTNRSVPAYPCQGPGCSRRSEAPAIPAPVSPEIPAEWAYFVEQIRDRDTASHGWSLESELLLVRGSGHRLERPPQGGV